MNPRVATGDASWSDHGQTGSKRAVLYLRVSTSEQARRGGEAEGFSIPAQREGCERKAASRREAVAQDFVDAGVSAKTIDRPALQRMLAYIQEHPVDTVIVHKLDRLARNALDALTIWTTLRKAGIELVSCSEDISDTPTGRMNFIVWAGIGEYHSSNLESEVIKGMAQKAKLGGTPGKAPLGYLNVSLVINDQVVRTIKIDPVRAPLIIWAFEAYATGEWPLRRLLEELTRRGLDIPATAKRPARPLSLSHLHRILSNPFYRGIVRFCGSEYPGRHEQLVDPATWHRVQSVLAAHRVATDKQHTYNHPLKGSIYCGFCRSRLIITNARGKSGGFYPYFICAGRHEKRTDCIFKAALIKTVEQHVANEYANPSHQLTTTQRHELEATLSDELAAFHEDSTKEQERLHRRRDGLMDKRARLLQAHLADAVPLDLLKIEQSRIREQLDSIEQRLDQLATPRERIERHLQQTLGLLADAEALYLAMGDTGRRAVTQALFSRIAVDDQGDVEGELAEPFKTLIGIRRRERRGLRDAPLVLLHRQLSNPPERLRKALDLHRQWMSNQRADMTQKSSDH